MPAFSGLRVFKYRGKKYLFSLDGFAFTKEEAADVVAERKARGIPTKVTPALKRLQGRFGRPLGGYNLWTPHGERALTPQEIRNYKARGVIMAENPRIL